MSDANSGNVQPEKQANDYAVGEAAQIAESPTPEVGPEVAPEDAATAVPPAAEGAPGESAEVSWADDGGPVAEVTEVVAEAPVASDAAELTEVVSQSAPEPRAPDAPVAAAEAVEAVEAVEVTEVVAAEEMPGAGEATEVVAAESTEVYPSAPAAGYAAAAVPPTTVENNPPSTPASDAGVGDGSAGFGAGAAGAAAAGAAGAAAAGAAPGWAAAPPPPPPPSYPAAAPGVQPGYQSAPPPSYAAAPPAGAAGSYGTVTPYQPGPQTSNKAVVAMVMAILSFVVCPVILAVAALIVGGQAKSEIQASNGWLTGEGLVTGAKIIAWVNIALTVLAVIFMFILFVALGNGLNDLQVNIDPSSGLGT